MKYAALFVLVAFAFVAQANAKYIERGAIADAMKAKLVVAKEKLNNMLKEASGKLKVKIADIKIKAEELLDQLADKAQKLTDNAYDAAEKIIIKVGKLEDKYFAKAESKAITEKSQPTKPSVESQ